MDAREIAREIDGDDLLRDRLRLVAMRRLGYSGSAAQHTVDVVRLLGVDETIRRMESRSAYLTFDGSQLKWVERGEPSRYWRAVSGRRGSMGPQHQDQPGKGPIPEGRYIARQDRLDRWENTPFWNRRLCVLRAVDEDLGGQWPGCRSAWGNRRVWLHPAVGTNTLNRSGSSIHGGSDPQSAGCIDLTSGMPSFVDAFVKYGRNMDVVVKY